MPNSTEPRYEVLRRRQTRGPRWQHDADAPGPTGVGKRTSLDQQRCLPSGAVVHLRPGPTSPRCPVGRSRVTNRRFVPTRGGYAFAAAGWPSGLRCTPRPGATTADGGLRRGRRVTQVAMCRCGGSVDLCVRCWDPVCPAPICFSCLLMESGMTRVELPELVNAVRPVRDSTQTQGRHARSAVAREERPQSVRRQAS
jgi:hypothetical protein